MRIFSIPDTGSFLNLVRRSQGDVILHLPDGNKLNLKQNHTAQQVLQILCPGQSGLQISLSSSADAPAFIRYMMEAGVRRFRSEPGAKI